MANEAKQIRKRHFPYYIMIAFGGAVLILFSILQKGDKANIWWETLIAIGQSLIIGPTISLILDLPSMVNYFKKITIQSLISKEYLNNLPKEELLELRKQCTAHIHLNAAQVVEHGLINMDEKICELLTMPYHERYRQNISCRIEGNYIVKRHQIEEYIINPLGGNGNSKKISEAVKNYVYKEDGENVNDIYKLIKYSVSIDEKAEVDYVAEGIKIEEAAYDTNDMTYNTQLTIVTKDNKELEFEFSKSIRMEKIYEVRVPRSDITFLKRLNMHAKSFRLDYHFPNAGIKLVAACFGTLAFSPNGNIKIIHENDYISVESYTWLLPGNGVFVVAV